MDYRFGLIVYILIIAIEGLFYWSFSFNSYFERSFIKSLASEWDYGKHGPDVWKAETSACAGKEQSPVNIEPFKTKYLSVLKPIQVVNYNASETWSMLNNGHTGFPHWN